MTKAFIFGVAYGAIFVLWLLILVPDDHDRTVNISDLHDDGCCFMRVPGEGARTGI